MSVPHTDEGRRQSGIIWQELVDTPDPDGTVHAGEICIKAT